MSAIHFAPGALVHAKLLSPFVGVVHHVVWASPLGDQDSVYAVVAPEEWLGKAGISNPLVNVKGAHLEAAI